MVQRHSESDFCTSVSPPDHIADCSHIISFGIANCVTHPCHGSSISIANIISNGHAHASTNPSAPVLLLSLRRAVWCPFCCLGDLVVAMDTQYARVLEPNHQHNM